MEEINFIALTMTDAVYLLLVGFVGGIVSGFIGSGGAFILTPAMMSMGVPGIVAVASNMCHKFPKALVGALKRTKYGHVDWKMGLIMGASAEVGVLIGAQFQEGIKRSFGDAGSNLYVSVAFVVVLALVGGLVLRDTITVYRSGRQTEEKPGRLAQWVQSVHIPGTMVQFRSLDKPISILFTIPLGLGTGLLAATIAVGGFIGVPAQIYVLGMTSMMSSATELVIAFVMGIGGTIKFAWGGYVDIRLAMIILAGSLFGIQLGAMGTTYVKPWLIKLVMAVIMLTVLFSRLFIIPVYLSQLGLIAPLTEATTAGLKQVSFAIMILALLSGTAIIITALVRGMRDHARERHLGVVH
ncbi:MAG: sulfite exporter TauE/SafE family protein [Magnetococcales bacterium]|nr:sulfite exporter TauE/SafE family protein [Magnetococcales bacterium]